MVGSLVLLGALGGCAQGGGPPPVQEASLNQNAMAEGIYHVQRGDTIYSIGWKTGIDYRRIAELNNLQPPYDIDPGQALRISQNASLADSGAGASGATTGGSGTRAIAMNGSDSGASSGGDDSWLAPDNSAIERNRSSADGGAAQGAGGASGAAGVAAGAATAGGGSGSTSGSGGSASGSSAQSADQSRSNAGQSGNAGQSSGNQSSGNQSAAGRNDSATRSSSATSQGGGAPGSSSSRQSSGQDTGGTAVAGGGANDRSDRTYTPAENINWQWPTEGRVVGNFSDQTNITAGIDIAGQKGQPVKAAGPGIVVYAGDGVRGYGNLVILKHNDQFLSAYAHNDTLNVKENDVVRQGETIATMGSTDADSVKLHFEIRQDGQPRDPLQYLPDR